MTTTEIENILRQFNLDQWQKEDLRIYLGDGTKPVLEGFEQVIGEKWKCKHCVDCIDTTDRNGKQYNVCNKYHFWFIEDPSYHRCMDNCFVPSDDTKAEIKLKDREIEDIKIDTHPRIFMSNNIHYYIKPIVCAVMTEFKPKKLKIRQARIKLAVIL